MGDAPELAASQSEEDTAESLLVKMRGLTIDVTGKDDLAYFGKNTFSKECAMLGFNFYLLLCELGIFSLGQYGGGSGQQDNRVGVISILYLFYKYQLNNSDMALNLATTLAYLEDTPAEKLSAFMASRRNNAGVFNLVVYTAYLAHAWNDDVTIRLKDWYADVGRIYFQSISEMNSFVWNLLEELRGFKLFAEERKVRRIIRKLCQSPRDT